MPEAVHHYWVTPEALLVFPKRGIGIAKHTSGNAGGFLGHPDTCGDPIQSKKLPAGRLRTFTTADIAGRYNNCRITGVNASPEKKGLNLLIYPVF